MKKKKIDLKNPHVQERIKENLQVDKEKFDRLLTEATRHEAFDKKK
jgi:hypothetical protein